MDRSMDQKKCRNCREFYPRELVGIYPGTCSEICFTERQSYLASTLGARKAVRRLKKDMRCTLSPANRRQLDAYVESKVKLNIAIRSGKKAVSSPNSERSKFIDSITGETQAQKATSRITPRTLTP